MSKFIITGTPRSGTTLLVNTLNQLPDYTVYGEICTEKGGNKDFLNHWQEEMIEQRKLKEENSLRTWLIQNNKSLNDNTIYQYLNNIFSRNRFVGFKLLYNHIERYPCTVNYILKNSIKVINVNRKDKIKQAISMLTKKSEKFEKKILVDSEKIKNRINFLVEKQQYIENLFKERLDLYYEDICNNKEINIVPDNISSKILKYIGDERNLILKVLLKKNLPINIEDIVKNYGELKNALL